MYLFINKTLLKQLKLPGVPPRAGLAPGKETSPPSLRNWAATEAAITELHTLCLHIKSLFFTNSTQQRRILVQLNGLFHAHVPPTPRLHQSPANPNLANPKIRLFQTCSWTKIIKKAKIAFGYIEGVIVFTSTRSRFWPIAWASSY